MSRRSVDLKPHKRKGYWYLARRVPKEYQAYVKGNVAYLSTGIRILDDPTARKARVVMARLDEELHQTWRDKRAGRDTQAAARYRKARDYADDSGFTYVHAPVAATTLPTDDILRRLDTLEATKAVENPIAVAGLLGGEAPPPLMLSEMLTEFENIVSASIAAKSDRQKQKWRVRRQSALNVFLSVVGHNKPIADITRADTLALRSYWQKRILAGEIAIDTANKNIGRVAGMFRAIDQTRQLGLPPHFDALTITGGIDKQRVAFDPKFVQTALFADGIFADLNDEARRLFYVLAETGLRPSEACNLTSATIKLDHEIPHVQVRPEGREMKTHQSRRDIPLVGAALLAMQLHPAGFPRYKDNADSLSALLNQALTARKLRPPEGQSLYSLRHTFEDRLTAVEAPEKVVASLMGHKWHRPKYGLGPTLQQKQSWLKKIAFKPPANL